MEARIYSIGYEKRNIEEYIHLLKSVNVDILIDVREKAWSYKRSFCKTNFRNSLQAAGIEYLHVKEAGNPRHIRKLTITHTRVLSKYKHFLRKSSSGLNELIAIYEQARSEKKNICLTCFEKNHNECHRSIILDELVHSGEVSRVWHL